MLNRTGYMEYMVSPERKLGTNCFSGTPLKDVDMYTSMLPSLLNRIKNQ
jgi:hypothetical protein